MMNVCKRLEPFFDAAYDDDCSICLCKISDIKCSFKLKCKHIFHLDCILNWELQKMYTCPLCREPFYTKIVVRINKLYDLLSPHLIHDTIEEYVFSYLDYHNRYSNYDVYDALYILYDSYKLPDFTELN
jgi:hypothetical protein